MDDLISRRAAIDAVVKYATWLWERFHETCNVVGVTDALREVPSAQPEPITVYIDHELTQDEYEKLRKDMANAPIMLLPSAQAKLDENDMPEQGDSAKFGVKTGETCTDCISRQAAIDEIARWIGYIDEDMILRIQIGLKKVPSAQTEPLTDKEQRIFLAAMTREENVCKKVDAEMSGEQYEDILVRVCREIVRKVKGALWTN